MLCSREFFIIIYMIPFFVAGVLCLYVLTLEECTCSREASETTFDKTANLPKRFQDRIHSSHKLAVLVPFRERFSEMLAFVPHISIFLKKQSVDHQIYLLNQVDSYRFNRASLINVGFKFASAECDYIAMHDVDLLPLNENLKYSYPAEGVYHVSSPQLHPRYNYPTFVGGILLVKREDFEKVNGMSNRYWGWGLEDDEFYVRLKDAKINVHRPLNITTHKNNTFRHSHDRIVHKRDMQKCYNQREVTRKRDHVTGLHDVQYRIQTVQEMTIDGCGVTVVNIELLCDRKSTPWCTCDGAVFGGSKQSPKV